MSTKKPTKTPSSTLSADQARAQSVLKAQEFIKAQSVMEQSGAPGCWYTDPQKDLETFKDWHIVRLVKHNPIYLATARMMSQKGYLFAYDVLPSLKCLGFETDGELGTIDKGGNAIYMLCPPDTHMMLREMKRIAQAKSMEAIRASVGSNLHSIPGLQGVEVKG